MRSFSFSRFGSPRLLFCRGRGTDEYVDGRHRDDIRSQLGVDPHIKKYSGCSDGIFKRFEDSNDVCVSSSLPFLFPLRRLRIKSDPLRTRSVKPSFQQVANILDAGVSVLLYVGKKDFSALPPLPSLPLTLLTDTPPPNHVVCDILGVEAWTLDPSFDWSDAAAFREEKLRPWYAAEEVEEKGDGRERAGEYRQVGSLAFAGVEGAGHFVRSFLFLPLVSFGRRRHDLCVVGPLLMVECERKSRADVLPSSYSSAGPVRQAARSPRPLQTLDSRA